MDKSSENWQIDERFPSRVETALDIVRQVVSYLKEQSWPHQDVFAVHMALEETLMNAIKHGNGNDDSKQIGVTIRIDDDRLLARITDEGEGFNPDAVADPCEEANLEKTTGRGLILIRSFVDKLDYIAPGNCVEFQKQRSAAGDPT